MRKILIFLCWQLSLILAAKAQTISSFSPITADVGSTVTLTGSGLSGVSRVFIGGSPVSSFTVVDNNTITFTVPSIAYTGNVSVATSSALVLSNRLLRINNPQNAVTNSWGQITNNLINGTRFSSGTIQFLGNGYAENGNILCPIAINNVGSLAGKTISQIVFGIQYGLALASDGSLHSWGSNSVGQLGNGNNTQQFEPVEITNSGSLAGKTIVSIAAGTNHSLAIASDGSLHAWGNNNNGQLGIGNTIHSNVPVLVNGGSLGGKSLVMAAAGIGHSLVLASDNTLHAFGQGSNGQLGNGSTNQQSSPAAVTMSGALSGKTISNLAVTASASFVLDNSGNVYSWGAAITSGAITQNANPVLIQSNGTLNGKRILQLSSFINTGSSVGGGFALATDGTVHSWGNGGNGALGNGSTGNSTNSIAIENQGSLSGRTVVMLSGGSSGGYALTSDGNYHSWGLNSSGRLGNGGITNSNVPILINQFSTSAPTQDPTGVVASNLSRSVTLSWNSGDGQGRLVVIKAGAAPVNPNAPLLGIPYTASTTFNSGALLDGGRVVFLGSGNGVTVTGLTPGTEYQVAVFEYAQNSCGLINYKTGSPATVSFTTPLLPSITSYSNTASVGGIATVTGRSLSGTTAVYLGGVPVPNFSAINDSTLNITIPSNAYTGILALESYGEFIMGRTYLTISNPQNTIFKTGSWTGYAMKDGARYAWGANNYYGNGVISSSTSFCPSEVINMGSLTGKTISQYINAGYVNFVIASDGSLHSWGSHSFGLLGQGATSLTLLPVEITNNGSLAGKSVYYLSASENTAIAIATDGTIHAWGLNNSGQLGINSTTNATLPTLVNGGSLAGKTIIQVYASIGASYALASDNTLHAWGEGTSGQLGNGASTNRNIPVAVSMSGVLNGKTISLLGGTLNAGFAVDQDGILYGWGNSTFAGINTNSNTPQATQTGGQLNGKRILSIEGSMSSAGYFTYALASDGSLYAWGSKSNGALADGTTSGSTGIAQITHTQGSLNGRRVVAVRASSGGGLALTSDGLYHSWGDGSLGRLGNGTNTTTSTPGIINNLPFTPPTTGPSALTISDLNAISATFTWTSGNGAGRIMVLKQGNTPVSVSSLNSGVAFTGNNVFGSGTPLDGGFVTLYANSNTVSISNLLPNTTYQYLVVEYNINSCNNPSFLISSTLSGSITTLRSPEINSFSPSRVSIGGTVTITGNYFTGTSKIWIGGVPVTSFNVVNDNTITISTPALAVSGNLTVETNGQIDISPRVLQILNPQNAVWPTSTIAGSATINGVRSFWGNLIPGNGSSATTMACPLEITNTGSLTGKTISQLSLGNNFVVVLASDGSVHTWGSNSLGALGIGSSSATIQNTPIEITNNGSLNGKTIVHISTTRDNILALAEDGTLHAWGLGNSGQNGVGNFNILTTPTQITGGTLAGKTVVQVATTDAAVYALASDNSLHAWGWGSGGGLGNGASSSQNLPVAVVQTGVLNGVKISLIGGAVNAGYAVSNSGVVYSWGTNSAASLSSSTNVPALTRTTGSLFGKQILSIAASKQSSGHALASDGTLHAWGNNDQGSLGINNTNSVVINPSTAIHTFGSLNGKQVVQFQPGINCAFAMTSDGQIHGWGSATDSRTGTGLSTNSGTPTLIPNAVVRDRPTIGVSNVAVNSSIFSATMNWTNGNGTNRYLIISTTTGASSFVIPQDGIRFSASTVYGQGSNFNNGFVVYTGTQNSVTVTGLSPNTTYNYAIAEFNALGSCGITFYKNDVLTTGSFTTSTLPTITSFSPQAATRGSTVTITGTNFPNITRVFLNGAPVSNFNQISATQITFTVPQNGYTGILSLEFEGAIIQTSRLLQVLNPSSAIFNSWGNSSIALSSGKLYGWGNRASLGTGNSTGTSNCPLEIGLYGSLIGKTIAQLELGTNFGVALASDSTLHSWGNNASGRLGNGNTSNQFTPIAITGNGSLSGRTVVQIAVGFDFAVALASDGSIHTWGNNALGQLGIGNTTSSSLPMRVNSGSLTNKTIVQITAGYQHVLALASDNTLHAWGSGFNGQLGNNSSNFSTTPVAVTLNGALNGRTISLIRAGNYASYAVDNRGVAYGWGSSPDAGISSNSLVPVAIQTSGSLAQKSVVGLALQNNSSSNGGAFAMASDGTIHAWGSTSTGGLGTGNLSFNSGTSTAITNNGSFSSRTVIDMANGLQGAAALTSDGLIHAWGSGSSGRLGDGNTNNANSPKLTLNFTADKPNTDATGLTITPVSATSATISWTNGSGSNRLVVVKAGTSIYHSAPVDGTTYSANANLGSGASLDGGFVVFNGTGSSVTVNNLVANTIYTVSVFEFNNGTSCSVPFYKIGTPASTGFDNRISISGTITAFNGCVGNPTAEQSITVAATGLSADLTFNAPIGFEISQTSNSGFTNSLNIPHVGGIVSARSIFIRALPSQSGAYSGTLSITSSGVATRQISLSGSAIASVTPSVSVSSDDADNQICAGNLVNFTAIAVNGGPAPTFSFLVNNQIVQTGSSNSYATSSLQNGDVVSVVLTANNTCQTLTTVASADITIVVNSSSIPAVSLSLNTTVICTGSQVDFSASATNGGNTPTYAFKVNGQVVQSGASNLFSTSSLQNGDVVEVELTSSNPCQPTNLATSNSITINLTAGFTPTVSLSASSSNICAGATTTFTAQPTHGGSAPQFEFFVNGNSVQTGTSLTYTTSALQDGDVVQVKMTPNNTCQTTNLAVSNLITVTVNSILTPQVALNVTSSTFCSGTPTTFTAVPTHGGSSPTYTFKVNSNTVQSGSANSYTASNFQNTDVVEVTLTANNVCQSTATATSNALTLTVIPVVTPTVTIQASASNVCPGNSVSFSAIPNHPGSAPTYTFRVNGNPVQVGSNNSYSNSGLTFGDVVSVTLTANNTCQSIANVSDSIAAPIRPNISVSINPISDLSIASDSVLLSGSPASGTFSGLGVSGNWFRPWLSDTGSISIQYAVNDAFGCIFTTTTNIKVLPEALVYRNNQWLFGTPSSSTGHLDIIVVDGTSPAIPNGAACRDLVLRGGSLTHNLDNKLTINRNMRLRGGNMIGGGTLRFTNAAAQINNSSLPIEFRADIEVATGANVTNTPNFRLAAGSNVMAGSSTPNGGGTTSGTWTLVQRGSTQLASYNAWSSPIVNGTGRMMTATNNFRFNAATQTWEAWDSSLIMTPGRGYIATAATNGWFRGTLHNGNYSYPVVFNSGGSSWNLIGNPYPSQLNLNDFLNANTNLNGTAYFMKTNVNVNVAVTDYTAINGLTVNTDVPVSQGFFVEANANGNATFTNSMRRAGRTAFYQRTQNNAELVWLKGQNLNAPEHQSNPLIGFKADATNGFDRMYDGRLLKGNTNIHFYSMLNNEAMTIQGLPTLTSTTIVPMGVEVTQAGSFELKLDSTTLDATVNIYLEDLQTRLRHNLRTGSFAFNTTQAQTWTSRFRLVFQPLTTSTPTIASNQPIKLYAFDQTLVIDALQGRAVKEVRLTDLSGRVIENWQQPQGESRIELPTTAANGVYLMTVITKDGIVQTERVLVRY